MTKEPSRSTRVRHGPGVTTTNASIFESELDSELDGGFGGHPVRTSVTAGWPS